MSAATYDLVIEAKADWRRSVGFYQDDEALVPANLTGYTASAMIKTHATDAAPLITITCTIPNPTTGVVVMEVLASASAAQNFGGKYFWDLVLTSPDGTRTRMLRGSALIIPGVTD